MRLYTLLSPSGTWCQGHYAFDKYGQPVNPESSHAVRWDLLGAIRRVYLQDGEARTLIYDVLVAKVGPLAEWNDTPGRTQNDVLTLLKEFRI